MLDNPAWAALTGPQSHLAEVRAKAARFQADITPFTALADPDDRLSWRDLAALVGPGATTAIVGPAALTTRMDRAEHHAGRSDDR